MKNEDLRTIVEYNYPDMPEHDCPLSEEDGCVVCDAYHEYEEELELARKRDEEKGQTYNDVTGLTSGAYENE